MSSDYGCSETQQISRPMGLIHAKFLLGMIFLKLTKKQAFSFQFRKKVFNSEKISIQKRKKFHCARLDFQPHLVGIPTTLMARWVDFQPCTYISMFSTILHTLKEKVCFIVLCLIISFWYRKLKLH